MMLLSTKTLTERIRGFAHPLIDSQRTEIEVDGNAQKQESLAVRLFDCKGHYVIADVPLSSELAMPGLLLTLYPHERRIHVENIYVKPEYYGNHIGTAFVQNLMQAARENGFRKVSLVADIETNAMEYWQKVHGFQVNDPERERYMERRV